MSDLPSVEVLETILHKCLEERDIEGVGHVLKLIAVQDPHRAQLLMDTMKVGIAIRRGE
jgi:hypothetical protein